MNSNINVEKLVEKSRFPKNANETLWIIVYFPLGVLLAMLRLFIAINAIFLTIILSNYPNVRRPLLRIILGVVGFIVVEKENSASKNSNVLASNHLSIFDFIALHLVTGAYTPTQVFSDYIALFFGMVCTKPNGINISDRLVLKQFIADEHDRKSLLLFPEEAPTNGKYALLRFSIQPAVLSDRIQPVALKITRPTFANVNISVLGSSYISEIFWFFFVPFTKFEYKLLEVIERSEDESNDTLMSRVEMAISQELNISTSKLSVKDKNEYVEKYLLELEEVARKRNKYSSIDNLNDDPDIFRMAAQISDVLPYVPQNVIVANLRRTRSVDITITNILDGTIRYTPIPLTQSEQKSASKKTEPDNFGVGSFMERKTKLINEARQRYIKKHGLHHLVQ